MEDEDDINFKIHKIECSPKDLKEKQKHLTGKEIKGISINIRNVSKNIDEFKIILREMGTEFDFISLVET